ncbi:hypothetical protein SASC598O02_008810 [Snodgrassella alvi SCGC AB-598-O02]|nr:hypothetical protein SASC598O02_008810 [Snodgrassella alvi SCGC AB-598-O02]
MRMTEQDVLAFLRAQPEWLNEHAAEFGLRPVESKILSFQQGRMLALKRKTEKMAAQLEQILADAEANRTLITKIMNFNQRLLRVNNITQWHEAITDGLSRDFSLPNHVIRINAELSDKVNVPIHLLASPEVRLAASKLTAPVCGSLPVVALAQLLDHQPQLESFLQLPLCCNEKTLGVLIIGHEDANHFQPQQSTEWVAVLAESMTIVLARILDMAD